MPLSFERSPKKLPTRLLAAAASSLVASLILKAPLREVALGGRLGSACPRSFEAFERDALSIEPPENPQQEYEHPYNYGKGPKAAWIRSQYNYKQSD